MINYKFKNVKTQIESEIICDVCQKKYSLEVNSHPEHQLYAQEFVNIYHTGGYASIFGDGSEIKCDICQDCFKIILETFMADKLKIVLEE